MDNQENIIIGLPSKKKINLSDNILDILFIVVPAISIILILTGALFYICGRINFNLAFVPFIIPWVLLAALAFFIINIIRLIRKNTLKKKVLILVEILLPIFLISLFFILGLTFNNLWKEKDPFLCGYRDQITRTINIDEVQTWLNTNADNLSLDDCPKSLKKYEYALKYDGIREDEYGNNIVFYSRGGGFFRCGFVIGTEDMVYPISEIMEERDEIWMLVQPGFYVFSQY